MRAELKEDEFASMVKDPHTAAESDLYNLKREVIRIGRDIKANPEHYEKREIKAAMKAMKEFKITGRDLIND